MSHSKLVTVLFLFFAVSVYCQEFSTAIADNSYFIEEAYNQEVRVVQNISNGYYIKSSKTFIASFTQEWPLFGQEHQLSYSIPYQSFGSSASGVGDILINYRYQLCDDQNWGWVSPRLSLILPTGKESEGLGSGVLGAQVNIPLSKRWTNEFVTHFNVGFTILPNVKNTIDNTTFSKTLTSYFAGVSGIWLINENFNFMLETLYSINAGFDDIGNVETSPQTIISPGIRYAINLGSLQIVPGLALPVTFQDGKSEVNVFGYLSFEFPY